MMTNPFHGMTRWSKLHLLYLFLFATIFIFSMLLYPPQNRSGIYVESKSSVISKPYDSEIFKERLSRYKAGVASLQFNLRLQITFILLSLFLIIERNTTTLDVPIIGVKLPSYWLFPVLILGQFYVWSSFCVQLADTIDDRIVMFNMLNDLEAGVNQKSYFSFRPLIEDAGFLDLWFILFRTECVQYEDRGYFFHLILIAVYMSIYGINHGCLLGLMLCSYRRLDSQSKYLAIKQKFHIVIGNIVLTLILLAYFSFAYEAQHPNYGFSISMLAFLISAFLTTKYVDTTESDPTLAS